MSAQLRDCGISIQGAARASKSVSRSRTLDAAKSGVHAHCMDEKPWVGITVRGGMESEEWFGQLDCSLEEFFQAPEHAFVRLNYVHWLESQGEFEEPVIVKNDEGDPAFHHFLFLRKSEVVVVRPLKRRLAPSFEEN